MVFRLDAIFSVERNSYGDVAWWLAGWLSVTAGIVSKRLNLSENFLDHLVGPSFKHLGPLTPIPTPNPGFKVTYNYKSNISKTVRFRDKVTID